MDEVSLGMAWMKYHRPMSDMDEVSLFGSGMDEVSSGVAWMKYLIGSGMNEVSGVAWMKSHREWHG